MSIPKYADKRAHKFFHRGFVGGTHGDDGTSYRMSWGSTDDGLVPTSVVMSETHGRHHPFCGYCGNRALPIQNSRYDVTGHTCVCKGAMDEVEWIALHKQMKSRHEDEMAELEDARPKVDPKVVARVAKSALDANVKDIERSFFAGHAMKRMGVSVQRPVHNEFDD